MHQQFEQRKQIYLRRGPSPSNSNSSSSTLVSSDASWPSQTGIIDGGPMGVADNNNNSPTGGASMFPPAANINTGVNTTAAGAEKAARAAAAAAAAGNPATGGAPRREVKLGVTNTSGHLAYGSRNSGFGLSGNGQGFRLGGLKSDNPFGHDLNLKPEVMMQPGMDRWPNANRKRIAFESVFAMLGLISQSTPDAVSDINQMLDSSGMTSDLSKAKLVDDSSLLDGTMKLTRRSSSPVSSSKGTQSTSSSAALTGSGNDDADSTGGVSLDAMGESDGKDAKISGMGRRMQMLRRIYCQLVCAFLWLAAIRIFLGLMLANKETRFTLLVLDFYHLGPQRNYYLIPALCVAIQSATVSLLFIRNEHETNWLVPFYSSKDYLITSHNSFKPNISDYKRRIRISIVIALVLSVMTTISLSGYAIFNSIRMLNGGIEVKTGSQSLNALANKSAAQMPGLSPEELAYIRPYVIMWAVFNTLWTLYSTSTCFVVSFYFNLICSIMRSRFHTISRNIEDLADSDSAKTAQQARRITSLYLEHNEACELLDESNDFWQYMIFYTYFTYIPGYCYCLYNLFFVEFEFWPNSFTWAVNIYSGFIICLVSFSASGVSTEAHAPYTSLHTLSLIQLPVDVEVNISTFLHRVRGLTIGYSCYDLFAVTNASMSNTAAACASYFLIVADFSRSSVFSNQQQQQQAMANGSAAAAGAAAAAVTTTTAAPPLVSANG